MQRFPILNGSVGIGLAAAAVVVAVFIGVQALGGPGVGGSGPIETPSPTSTAALPPASPFPFTGPTAEVRPGLLKAGAYEYLDVDRQGFNVLFTVPAGWTWNGRFLSKGGVDRPEGAAIFFFGGPMQVYADPCHWAGAPSNPPTGLPARDLVAALAAQPSRSATTPFDRPYGYWPGMAVELTVPGDLNLADCDGGQFRSWGPENNPQSHQGPGQRDLVWAVDVPGAGVTNDQGVIIVAPPVGGLVVDAASFPGTPADVKSEIDAILRSIHMGHWG